jgi:hypothetical protein
VPGCSCGGKSHALTAPAAFSHSLGGKREHEQAGAANAGKPQSAKAHREHEG